MQEYIELANLAKLRINQAATDAKSNGKIFKLALTRNIFRTTIDISLPEALIV